MKTYDERQSSKAANAVIYGHVQRSQLLDDLCLWAMVNLRRPYQGILEYDDFWTTLDVLSMASLMHPLAVKATMEKAGYIAAPGSVSCSSVSTKHKRLVTHHRDLFA